MRLAQATRIGAWMLIGLNILMALGSIWIFMRMSPAIKEIIEQNEHSLQACEEMLASLAVISDDADTNRPLSETFQEALNRARNNITEEEEPAAIEMINSHSPKAFKGDIKAKEQTVAAIILLGKINREAMVIADLRARQFGQAGAWGVVFMATCVFFAGMLFNRNLSKNVVRPIEEIHDVIFAYRNGDTMRRCSGADLPADFISVFNGINEILDKCQSQFSTKNRFLI
ncbi:MAG: hypothetical protein HQK62_05620 [Desulfamplus sp.]|nr:hypothetical protein [Desulfamplus sp.]